VQDLEQNPSQEYNTFSASHEIPHLLWNRNAQYHIHNSSQLNLIASQFNLQDFIKVIIIISFHLNLCLPGKMIK